MDRKGGSTAVVTKEQVIMALEKAKTTAAEEKALRMRYGAPVERTQTLPTAYGDNEALGDELLLIELQLLKAVKAHRAAQAKLAPVAAPKNAAKDKIVRGLKAKKS
jgi:folylpolyglutamate synthase/dihydropteroate synthase